MSQDQKTMRTDMGWSTVDRITVRGLDLPSQILGKLNLGDVAFLELTGRLPSERESVVFNAIAVTLVEHGPSTRRWRYRTRSGRAGRGR